jgi:hypothetical protein
MWWRRVFAVVAAGSAVVCALAAGMWVRGLFVRDDWVAYRYRAAERTLETRVVDWANGWVLVTHSVTVMPPGVVPRWMLPMNGTWRHDAGPANVAGVPPAGARGSLVVWQRLNTRPLVADTRSFQVALHATWGVRLMMVVVVSAILPAGWVWGFVRGRQRARRAGCCPGCGYDLRASPERCPECGRVVGRMKGEG